MSRLLFCQDDFSTKCPYLLEALKSQAYKKATCLLSSSVNFCRQPNPKKTWPSIFARLLKGRFLVGLGSLFMGNYFAPPSQSSSYKNAPCLALLYSQLTIRSTTTLFFAQPAVLSEFFLRNQTCKCLFLANKRP